MGKKILLTGDRPTGPLHLGHYVGTLKNRVELQHAYETFIMLADAQAITDNFKDIGKVRKSVYEVLCDYIAVGLDPKECHFFIQSQVSALPELTMYLLNLVTIQAIGHNPTVKAECKTKKFTEGVPAGFYLYPVYQVADIVAFKADIVPVGPDQAPMLELTRDLARRFNMQYQKEVLVVPEALYPKMESAFPGIDGQKMSKSLGNAISLSDPKEEILQKVKKMKSDPSRLSIQDPGDPDKAIAFRYLELFDPEPERVEELKASYRKGGMADKVVKERLTEVLLQFLEPIQERRRGIEKDPDLVWDILSEGTKRAIQVANKTLEEAKEAMGIDYEMLFSRRSSSR